MSKESERIRASRGRAWSTRALAMLQRHAPGAALVVGLLAATSAFAADPQIAAWTDRPDPVPAGGPITYSARIENSALDAAINVVVSVPVPAGTTFVSATSPCALAAGTVSCTLGTIGGSGTDTRNLDFVFRANGPGPTSVTAVATLTSDNDANASNNTQSQTTTVISGGDLALTKSASPNPVVGGANVTYTLIASNAGPNVSGDIVVTDNLPPAVSFVSSSGSGWTCSVASGVATCTHAGPHAVGVAIPALVLVARVNAAGGTITNSATVAPANVGGTADPDTSNNTATVNTTVTAGADVRIAQKTVTSATPATAGQNVTFSIQPRNGGPAAAVNAVVTDVLPAGWTFVSASGPNWTCGNSGQTVTCSRAAFAVGTSDDITVVARPPNNAVVGPTGTTYTNTASIASATVDPDPTNDSGSVGILVLPDGADLRIGKTKTPNPVALGSPLTSTISVTNNGPRIATGPLRVVEFLTGETFASASGSGWSCAQNGATVSCSHANAGGLAVGASLPALVIVSTATVAGSATNNACTGSSLPAGASGATASPPLEGDSNATNDCQSVTSNTTSTRPDLAIAKTTSTPTGGDKVVSTSEGSVTYTLVARNATSPGSDAATGVVIRDTVPAYLSGRTTISAVNATVSAGTATFGCTISGADVTCTQSGGALLPGQTVTVPITVNRPMQDGTFTNTATVGNTAEGDPDATNNSASDTVQIDPIADIEVTGKTVTPTSVRAGEPATYVVSYRNNGPSAAANVNLTDGFTFAAGDAGATVLSIVSSKPGSTCSIAAGATLAPGAASYSCAIGTLANGETQSITLVVRPKFQAGNAARSFGNTASIVTTTIENPAGGDNGNNSRSATLPVAPALVDLLINKTDLEDPVPFAGNAFINYRVSLSNNGPSYATGVRFTEAMTPPAGRRIRFVCDTNGPSSAVCNAPSLCTVSNVTSTAGTTLAPFTCAVPSGTATTGTGQGELAANQSKIVYLRFEALDTPTASGDVYNNVATVSANEPDSFAANDAATEQTTVRQRIDLAVAKTSSLASVVVHQPFTWTVTVTNNGPGNALQTDLVDTLPAGVTTTGAITFTRTSPAGSGTCMNAAGTLTCALGALASGGVATITIPVRVDTFPAGGTSINSATVDTDPTKIGGIDPVPGNNTATSAVTVTQSTIAGIVFQDVDRSGANAGTPQSASIEPRIAGVTVTLSGTDAFGNAVNLTTTTDASGAYLFDGLSPSNAAGYVVTEMQPAGFSNSPSNPPTAGAAAPSAGGAYAAGGATGDSRFGAIVLPAATAAVNYNFPEVRQPTLSGFVYVDANGNGLRDVASDPPIAGATVLLRNAGTGSVVATTTTDASGAYRFANLDPSIVYTIEEPLPATPAGLGNGPVNAGLIGGVACTSGCVAQPDTPTAGTDRIAGIDLGSGADGTLFNFGERQQSSIAGAVYIDRNRNGTMDPSPTDGRIAGVTIRLVQGSTCATGTTLQTATTATDGSYAFANAIAGQSYLVCESQPAGYAQGINNPGTGATVPNVEDTIAIASLPTGGSTGNNFGEIANDGSIAGRVYVDANNDGVKDATEAGIAGVTIQLAGTDASGTAVSRSTVTDATGAYVFGNLAPGTYRVNEPVQPTGTLNGITTAGSAGGSATPVGTSPSAIATIALVGGQVAIANDFGEIAPASIGGRVFADNNGNGLVDNGETGIGAVTIVLTGTDDQGNAVNVTTTTDAAGNYAFPSLRPGTYAVTEPTQPPGTVNGITTAGTIAGTTAGIATAPAVVPSAIRSIVLAPGAQSIANNFGELGNSPDLLVTKAAVEPRFTVGNVGTYTIRVRNGGQSATSGVYRVSDRLPVGLTLDATPTGAGWTCAGTTGATTFTCTTSDPIVANATNPNAVTVKVRVGIAALAASPVDNAVSVDGGGELDARAPTQAERDAFDGNTSSLPACVPGITQNACRVPTIVQAAASISGTAWYDIGTARRVLDGGDRRLPGWNVEVLDASGNVIARTVTAVDGTYRVADLVPGVPLTVRFRDPQSNVVWGYPVNGESATGSSGASCNQANAIAAGTVSSCVGTGADPTLTVVLAAGQNLPQQSLPVDPGGVVYDSGVRQPVPGATVTLAPVGTCPGWDPATSLVAAALGGYTIAGSSASMTVGTDGFYQFLFAPGAPARCTFGLTVVAPASYRFVSTAIPPSGGPLSAPGGAGSTYDVAPQAGPPTGAVGPATTYFLSFVGGSAGPNLLHNHLPLDPAAGSGLTISKTGDKSVVEVGDSVRYTVTVIRNGGAVPRQVTIVDRLPRGFTYIAGTAVVGGVPVADPSGKPGPRLAFDLGPMSSNGTLVLQYRARVGVGSQQGDGVNHAIGFACGVPVGCTTPGSGAPIASAVSTNEAQYRVRVTGGVFTTDACLVGKVFVDCNGNHVQDPEELGIPGVRLVMSDGTTLISDSEGKYSLCGLAPRSHVLKIDPHTLPIGSRLTTSSNRNLGDAGSLWLDLKNGELFRADFVEGSCTNQVLDQVKARRAQGEIRSVETEKPRGPALRFESKAHGLDRTTTPKEGTDSANQLVPKPREDAR